MKKIELLGTVTSGKGEGRNFVELPWVNAQIQQHLGFEAYPGTLNLKLSPNSRKLRATLVERKSKKISPSAGYCEGLLFKARVANLQCGVIIPQVENYQSDLLELIAPVNLRERLQLCDGSQIKLVIDD